jgi:hypothetical protein
MRDFSRLGMQFGEHVQKVTAELLTKGTPKSVSEMERRTRQAVMEMGRFLLGAWLGLLDGAYPESEIPCRCGGKAHYQCRRDGELLTLLGTVHYERAYYLCAQCHQGTYPLDEQLGLRAGELSAELESLLGMTGALMTFAKGSEFFTRLTLVDISAQSMDKATQRMGEEVSKLEAEWHQASEDDLALTRQERAAPDGRRLYGTLDATKVHTHERQDEADEGWRDLKVGAWFESDAPPPEVPQEDWDIQARNLTYFCDFGEAKEFGKLFWATGIQREALRASERIFLGDGAEWIWNLVEEHFPHAVQIVDWFHAAEHLSVVAKAVFQEESAQKTWLQDTRQRLWEGQVRAVIQTCETLAREGRGAEEARKAALYFTNHAARMDYATYRRKGYQIGSGTVESACKQLGILRMKVPGATWNRQGARFTAKARAAFLSDQWEILTARREYLPRVA